MSQPQGHMQHETPAADTPQDQAQAPAQEPARLGPIQRLTGILFSPGETFQDINRKPTWIVPTLIAIVIAVAGNLFFDWRANPDWEGMVRREIKKQADRSGREMPPDNVIRMQASMQRYFAVYGSALKPVKYLIIAGVFALGLMFMQAQTTFRKILSVVAWSDCGTELVDRIVKAASLMVRSPESLQGIDPSKPGTISATNPAFLLPENAPVFLQVIAASIDLFVIWFLILLTIGLVVISGSRRVTKAKTGILVFVPYIILVLIFAGVAAAFSG
jgi:hypothetical protein